MAQKFLTGVQLINGSAGSPALSFSSDTNTGIYRSAEDHLSVSVNGSARLTVSVNGITSSSNVYSGSNGQFRNYSGVWKATTGVSGNGFEFTSADQTGVMTLTSNGNLKVHNNIRSQGHSTTGLSGKGMELRFFTDTDVGSILSYDRSNSTYLPIGVFGSTVSLQTNGTERLHITSAGNVGIGVAPASIGQKLRVNGNIKIGDSQKFLAGAGDDLEIQHTGTHSFITNATGDLTIANYADDRSIYFQSDDGSGGSINYIQIEGSTNQTKFHKNTKHLDSVEARFGASNDLVIKHNGTNSVIDNTTGNLIIQNQADDADITFRSDDGSGGTAEYLKLSGSTGAIITSKSNFFGDNVKAIFGAGSDLEIYHNATDSVIENNVGDLYITNKQDDGDIVFRSDDGSGGYTTYFFLDGSLADGTNVFTKFGDNSWITMGSSGDLLIGHQITSSKIENYTGALYIVNKADDQDIIFQSDDGSGGLATYFFLDGSSVTTQFYKTLKLYDAAQIYIGDDNDFRFYHNGTSNIDNYTGNLDIIQRHNDGDIRFYNDNGSGGTAQYFRVDGGITKTVFIRDTKHEDSVKGLFGTNDDLQVYHDGSNSYIKQQGAATGDIIIEQNVDDKDIIFRSDDGSGGVAEYFSLDGSIARVKFSKNLHILDNVRAEFGGNNDLQIYHDGSNSFISDTGTGNLNVQGSIVAIESPSGENYFVGVENSYSAMYYDNSIKLQTTSTGISITGDLTVSGTTTTVNQTNLDVSDNIIGLNRGSSTNTNDSGLIIERGSTGDNAAFLWDESEDKFIFGLTTATPSATGNVSLSDYRGIKTGPITASGSITATGSVGIGTTSPSSKLHIDSTSDAVHFTRSDQETYRIIHGTSGLYFTRPDSSSLAFGVTQNSDFQTFDTSGNVLFAADASTGRVGVNTSSPGAKLHVVESTVNTQAFRVDDGTSFVSVVPSLGGGGYTGVSTAGDIGLIFSIDGDSSTDTSNGLLIAPHTQTSGGLKILENGNVGIGVATPNTKLQVAGIIQSTESGNSAFYGGDYVRVFNNQNFRFRNSGGSAIANIAMSGNTYFNGGNFGIGTTAPAKQLTISSTTPFIRLEENQSGGNKRLDLWVDQNAIAHIDANQSASQITLRTASTDRLRITNAGNVGIGTTSPSSKLHLQDGDFRITGVFPRIYLQDSNNNSDFSIINGNGNLRFYDDTNAADRLYISANGNVAVGSTSPQTNTKLEVSGALKAGNKTSWSDRDGDPLTTTGRVVAGLTGNANGNGASAMYIFTCYGGNGYQRIVYSCRNQSGTWVVNKDIDEGVDAFDVVASTPSSGSAVTFTFKGRTSTQSYTASVFIEHMGHNLDTQYVG